MQKIIRFFKKILPKKKYIFQISLLTTAYDFTVLEWPHVPSSATIDILTYYLDNLGCTLNQNNQNFTLVIRESDNRHIKILKGNLVLFLGGKGRPNSDEIALYDANLQQLIIFTNTLKRFNQNISQQT